MPTPIVLVCNDSSNLRNWSSALKQGGHEVAGFTVPMQALDAIRTTRPIRVLVTCIDFGPGKLNGISLARMARYRRPGVSVVFAGDLSLAPHTEGLGDLKPLPLNGSQLLGAIRELMQNDRGSGQPE